MGSLSQAKTLGGVGAILMLVGVFVPFASFVGLILLFLGVKNISEVYNDEKIKSDFIFSIILAIIAAVLLVLLPFLAFGSMGFGVATFASTGDPLAGLGAALAICAIVWIIIVIFYILSAVYLKKSFESIARHTNVDMFKTAALVYLIGAILTIVVFGAFIMLIAYILMIVAFFGLPDSPTMGGQPGMMGQGGAPGRVCPNCGRPIPNDAQVCPYCGKDFRPPPPQQ